MIGLLDYIQDVQDNFWIVSHLDEKNKGYMVYRQCDEGNRYHPGLKKNYQKELCQGSTELPQTYKRIFHPKECYQEIKKNLRGVWKQYIEALHAIGISDDKIGVFGSTLVGFPIQKDVDFILYGEDSLACYQQNIEKIHQMTNTTSISKEHIAYQYQKYYKNLSINCDLFEALSRNWSGIQLENGVLSTPRFILDEQMRIPKKTGANEKIEVQVLDGLFSNCVPRMAKVLYQEEVYQMYVTFWMFQSFARDNEYLTVYGNVDRQKKTIILDQEKVHYIKYQKNRV